MPKHQSARNGKTHGRKSLVAHGAGETGTKKPGRKPGKHSSSDYTQTSIYLPIELRNRVRAKLYEQGLEMSGLVEEMLREWLDKRQ